MNILGLSDVTGNHSHSSVALLQDGRLAMALSQERVSRIKNDSTFPQAAIEAVLSDVRLRMDDIDVFACGYPAPRYYTSLLERSPLDLPRTLAGVALRRPDRLLKYLLPNLKKAIYDPSHAASSSVLPSGKLVFIDHHLAHVTAAYAASGTEECLAISYGGFAPHADGRNVAGAVYRCCGDDIEFLQDIPYFATGCWFSGVTVALGYRYMEQEGKTMGLAGLGDAEACYDAVSRVTTRFIDGTWRPYAHWLDYVFTPRADVFLSSRSGRFLQGLLKQHRPEEIAAAAQRVWQENLLHFIRYLIGVYRIKKFALAGGLFLNAAINRLIAEQAGVESLFIFPHAGDGSTPIGAALQAHRSATGVLPRRPITDAAWGCGFDRAAVLQDLQTCGGPLRFAELSDAPAYAAKQINDGKIIGWFQGREEYGPRSLGQRCILADPRRPEMKRTLNRRKQREEWIPLGVSCLAEQGDAYFDHWQPSPFMTRLFRVRGDRRAEVPAAVHGDGSCRVQAVAGSADLFRKLLECFYGLTGTGMVLNSSLNRHGEPIVHRPADAMHLLLAGVIDELVIGDSVIKSDREAA